MEFFKQKSCRLSGLDLAPCVLATVVPASAQDKYLDHLVEVMMPCPLLAAWT